MTASQALRSALPPLLLAATLQPLLAAGPLPAGDATPPATVHLLLADHHDATTSRWWVLGPHAQPRAVAEFQHAPGAVPRGFVDAQGALWVVLADGPGKDGSPARLARVDAQGHVRTHAEGLPLPQAAVPSGTGGALVVQGNEQLGWTLFHAPAEGPLRAVMRAEGAWMVPVHAAQGACALVQNAWTARVLCGAEAVPVRTWTDAMVRDVTLLDGTLTAVEARRQGAVLVREVRGTRTEHAPQAEGRHAPVVAGARAVLSGGVGEGAWVLRGGVKENRWMVVAGTRAVPLAASGRWAVVRVDEEQGRRPAQHVLLDLDTGHATALRTGASVVEVVGVQP